MTASEVVMMDAGDLAAAIRDRRLSAVEVMSAYLDHIEALNPSVNAIVALQPRETLLREAAARDAQLARGEIVGPLYGLPHAAKDLQPVKGLPFTQGSPIFKDFVAPGDSIAVARLRAAGVIFIGKTNTPEFGLGSHTYNPVYGITRNAYDPARSAGGSSGGAAVALALRMLPLADGSDYGGSLRNPAGWNNVFGFRVGVGRAPVLAKDGWLPSMGVVGPMARNVNDLALLLSVMAGWDARAPLSLPGDGMAFRPPIAPAAKGKRIAWLGDLGGAIPYEPGVLETCRAALKSFEAAGCVVEEATPDYPPEKVWDAFVALRGWQQGGALKAFYDDPAKRALLKPEAVWEVETGAKLSGYGVSAASEVRTEWTAAVRQLFQRYDFLVMPTAQLFPFPVEQHWPTKIAGHAMQSYHAWMKAVCLVSMCGSPALAVPAGLGPGGLPIGLQIVAPIQGELAALEMAAAYEAANPQAAHRLPPALKRPA